MNPFKRWQAQRQARRHQQAVAEYLQDLGLHVHALGGEATNAALEARWEQVLHAMVTQLTQVNHERSTWRFVLQMLIASHANPELLLRNWHANLPNLVDELHDHLPQGNQVLRDVALETWKQELQRFTRLIEATAQARRDAEAGPT